jgi:phage gpG-like protein
MAILPPKYNPEKVAQIAKKWGAEQKSALALQLAQLGLKDRGDLINSLSATVRKKTGDVEAVTFRYLYYGLFHEVGATNVFGKGVNLQARSWQAKAINPKIEELADQVGEYYADVAVKNIHFNSK